MFCYSRESHTSQGDYHCVPKNEKGSKEGHLPLHHPINPVLPEGDNWRQKPVTSCVSQDSFIFPSPYVLILELPPHSVCLQQLKIISHLKQADKKVSSHFHCRYYNRKIINNGNSTHLLFFQRQFSTIENGNCTLKQKIKLNFEMKRKKMQSLIVPYDVI